MAYRVEWTPTAKVEAAATKRGMKPDDGTSFWDWCEPEEFTESIERSTFALAAEVAKNRLPFDAFGETRIVKTVRVRRSYGKIEDMETAIWHVHDGDEHPDEAAPDYHPEPDLFDGDVELGA